MVVKIQILFATLRVMSVSVSMQNEAVTFTTSDSFVRVIGYEGSYNMNMSFQLRTWQEEGVVVFHKFSSSGHLKIFLHEGRLMAEVVSSGGGTPLTPLTTLEHYDTLVNDGGWHSVQFYIAQTQVGLSINSRTITGSLPSQVRTGGACSLVRYVSYTTPLCRQLLQHWRRAAWTAGIYRVYEEHHGGWRVQEQLWLVQQQPGGYSGWFLLLD